MIATLIIIASHFIMFGINIAKHGEPKEELYNGYYYFFSMIIVGILFYYAGLFDKFN